MTSYILDANILLNAAFLYQSQAGDLINELLARGHLILVDEHSRVEAKVRLLAIGKKLRLPYEPWAIFEKYWGSKKHLLIPAADHRWLRETKVNKKIGGLLQLHMQIKPD